MASVSLDDIIDAFISSKPELKMKEIKDYVFKNRGSSFEGYKNRYSFDQTIQKIVEIRTPTKKGYIGEQVFVSPVTGYYQLSDKQRWLNKRKVETIDEQIAKLGNEAEILDLETTRTLREINIISRNPNLVRGLKTLYGNTCQICGTKIKIKDEVFYSEVHHIKSLGQPHNGPDSVKNMLVVCPNCHVMLDFKTIKILKDKIKFLEPHKVDDSLIEYHNNNLT